MRQAPLGGCELIHEKPLIVGFNKGLTRRLQWSLGGRGSRRGRVTATVFGRARLPPSRVTAMVFGRARLPPSSVTIKALPELLPNGTRAGFPEATAASAARPHDRRLPARGC